MLGDQKRAEDLGLASPAFVKRTLAGRKRVSAAMLAELPAVVTQPGAPWRFLGPGSRPTELVPRPHFSANDPRVAVAAAKAGLGVVRAPRELIERQGKALVQLECELGQPESRDMFAVYPSRRLLPARAKTAIEWVRKGGRG